MAEFTTEQVFAQAMRHHRTGEVKQARTLFEQVLARDPEHVGSLRMLGRIELAEGHAQAAARLLARAVEHDPESAELHANFGAALASSGQLAAATAEFKLALTKMPDSAALHANLASALLESGHISEAAKEYERAVALQPQSGPLQARLAGALAAAGRFAEAVAAFERAGALSPDDADLKLTLGDVYWRIGRPDRAADAYRSAQAQRPAIALERLARALKSQGQIEAAIESLRQSLQLRPDPDTASALLYSLHFAPDSTPESLLAEHVRWNETYARPLATHIQPHANDPDPHRRLRIGYAGQGMNNTGVGRFLLPLLRCHDRSAFETFCYFSGPTSDEVTDQLRSQAGTWRDIAGMPDEAVAQRVREDGIDILVDLNLHAGGGRRLLVFARKPAPVQVTWLGYCSTTGLAAMDYRLTDPYLDPPGAELTYVEETVRLPHCFWCYGAPPEAPSLVPPPATGGVPVTFGCLNLFDKINPAVIEVWAQLLRQVPASRLLLHCMEGSHRQVFLQQLASRGVAPYRIAFVGFVSSEEYLRAYQQIDIALDPFPYPGGTTTCDALWMGVPVVTLPRKTGVSRGGVSILSNVGLTEFIASTPEHYIQITADLAGDLPRLTALRSTMRDRMLRSPLMDIVRFTADLEAAFRNFWVDWCRKRQATGEE